MTTTHYDTRFAARMKELEDGCERGLSAEELYRAEADLALRELGPIDGGSLLDVGCGTGQHAFLMSDALGHRVPIRAYDMALAVIDEARLRLEARRTAGIREDLEFSVGDILELRPSTVDPRLRFRAITCLGDSFGYHNNAQIRRVLKNFFDILEPGGRLIMQFRERLARPAPEVLDRVSRGRSRLGFVVERRVVDGEERTLFRDPTRGDAMYEYDVDCPHPDPAAAAAYEPLDRDDVRLHRDRDDWEYSAYSSCYFDPEGRRHAPPPIWMVRSFVAERPFAAMQRVLAAIGFADGALAEGPLLGAHRNLAITATRP